MRDGEIPIFSQQDEYGAFFINLDKYLIVPLETPLDEIYIMVTEQLHRNAKNEKYGKEK